MFRLTIRDLPWLFLYSIRVLLLVVAYGWLALIGLVIGWVIVAAFFEGFPSGGNFPGGILTWYLSVLVVVTMPWAAGAYVLAAALRLIAIREPPAGEQWQQERTEE